MGWPWSLWLHACMQLWVPTTLNPELSLTSTLHHESLIESFFFLVQHSYIFFLVKTKLYILTEYDLLYFVYIILTMDFEECTSSTFFFFEGAPAQLAILKCHFIMYMLLYVYLLHALGLGPHWFFYGVSFSFPNIFHCLFSLCY